MAIIIQRLEDSQIEAAKSVIRDGCLEFFGEPPLEFRDMDEISAQYSEPSGIFLVLMDGERVVGTGAIRRLDERTCELKRMWLLPAYRKKGHGGRICARLLQFACTAGYERIRLDTASELADAKLFYERLGFYPIDRYNDGPATIFMEKRLQQAQEPCR